MTEEEENYWIVFEMLTDLLEEVAKRRDIPREHLLAPFADVLAGVALKSGETPALAETISYLVVRLEQAGRGEFPPS